MHPSRGWSLPNRTLRDQKPEVLYKQSVLAMINSSFRKHKVAYSLHSSLLHAHFTRNVNTNIVHCSRSVFHACGNNRGVLEIAKSPHSGFSSTWNDISRCNDGLSHSLTNLSNFKLTAPSLSFSLCTLFVHWDYLWLSHTQLSTEFDAMMLSCSPAMMSLTQVWMCVHVIEGVSVKTHVRWACNWALMVPRCSCTENTLETWSRTFFNICTSTQLDHFLKEK